MNRRVLMLLLVAAISVACGAGYLYYPIYRAAREPDYVPPGIRRTLLEEVRQTDAIQLPTDLLDAVFALPYDERGISQALGQLGDAFMKNVMRKRTTLKDLYAETNAQGKPQFAFFSDPLQFFESVQFGCTFQQFEGICWFTYRADGSTEIFFLLSGTLYRSLPTAMRTSSLAFPVAESLSSICTHEHWSRILDMANR